MGWINTIHPTIKFTANYGTKNIPYLDVSISIEDGKITTDLHVKDTDANMCLPFSSCHPRHCPRNIPYSQCLRIRRICSDEENYTKRIKDLNENLSKRGYPQTLLEEANNKVSKIPREEALKYKVREQSDRPPIIVTHNPANPPISTWSKELMPVLHTSSRMRKAVPLPPVVGERNCRNLKSILMPTKLQIPNNPQTTRPGGNYPCTNGCLVCQCHLRTQSSFSSVVTGQSYNIREAMDCSSSNVVYLIDCAACGQKQYVGETCQEVRKRFYSHRCNVNKKRNTLVAKHFCGPGHGLADMRLTIIEQCHSADASVRKRREKFWRHKLHSNFPDGLNVFD